MAGLLTMIRLRSITSTRWWIGSMSLSTPVKCHPPGTRHFDRHSLQGSEGICHTEVKLRTRKAPIELSLLSKRPEPMSGIHHQLVAGSGEMILHVLLTR